MALLEAVCTAVGGSCTVIAHVGAISLRDTLTLARHAARCGVQALSSVTPAVLQVQLPGGQGLLRGAGRRDGPAGNHLQHPSTHRHGPSALSSWGSCFKSPMWAV